MSDGVRAAVVIAASAVLAGSQLVSGVRVGTRMIRTARRETVRPVDSARVPVGAVTVVVPVLNEQHRLGPCLAGLTAQGSEVAEVLVVDGGSADNTLAVAQRFMACDARVRWVDASPVPAGWNGKAWGLAAGERAASRSTRWIVTLDADVRPAPALVAALVAFAAGHEIAALSVATRQRLAGLGMALVHPAQLATLVYRFGAPGRAERRPSLVQANGQCALYRRDALDAVGGFASVAESICEDVTLARALALAGVAIGFYEAGELVDAEMYANAGESWTNWSRSLPLRDRYWGTAGVLGLLDITLAQALPLPLGVLLLAVGRKLNGCGMPLLGLNLLLVGVRLGVLTGISRAYRNRPWTYWLSPLCDLPVVLHLWQSAFQREHVWRGRVLMRGGNS